METKTAPCSSDFLQNKAILQISETVVEEIPPTKKEENNNNKEMEIEVATSQNSQKEESNNNFDMKALNTEKKNLINDENKTNINIQNNKDVNSDNIVKDDINKNINELDNKNEKNENSEKKDAENQNKDKIEDKNNENNKVNKNGIVQEIKEIDTDNEELVVEQKDLIDLDEIKQIITSNKDNLIKVAEDENKKLSFSGISDRNHFIKNQQELEDYVCIIERSQFEITNLTPDENSAYRSLSLQIFGTQDHYKVIRKCIFTFLFNNIDNIKKYYFERKGKTINAQTCLKILKRQKESITDLELQSLSFLINAKILLFELKEDQKIYFLGESGKIEDNEQDKKKIFINL